MNLLNDLLECTHCSLCVVRIVKSRYCSFILRVQFSVMNEEDEPIPEDDVYIQMRSSVYDSSAAIQLSGDAQSTVPASVRRREKPVRYLYRRFK